MDRVIVEDEEDRNNDGGPIRNQGGPVIQGNSVNQGDPPLNGVNPNPQNNNGNRQPYVARHFGYIPQGEMFLTLNLL